MKQGISIREFARREGVSDTLVRRALKTARLKAFDDGSLDPNLVGTAWCEANAKGANTSANTQAKNANTPAKCSHPAVRTKKPSPPPPGLVRSRGKGRQITAPRRLGERSAVLPGPGFTLGAGLFARIDAWGLVTRNDTRRYFTVTRPLTIR